MKRRSFLQLIGFTAAAPVATAAVPKPRFGGFDVEDEDEDDEGEVAPSGVSGCDRSDPLGQLDTVFCSINGRSFWIKRGVPFHNPPAGLTDLLARSSYRFEVLPDGSLLVP